MEDWMLGPPLLIGERVVHELGADQQVGTVRWLGRIPAKFGGQMVVGVELVSSHSDNWLWKQPRG